MRSVPLTSLSKLGLAILAASMLVGTAGGTAGRRDSFPRTDEAVESFERSATAINAAIRRHHYNPALLDSPAYWELERKVLELGRSATSKQTFLDGFRAIWKNGPFSHVALLEAAEPAEHAIARIDSQPAGESAVVLEWRDSAAVLKINTMSGPDTIERINDAYADIVSKKATRLIIDLRANIGGAFAVMPLI